jgi:hypothetical protein
MTAAKVAPLREMPLDEKSKGFNCRTGNYILFQLFHLRHRLPGSAALIIFQNFASCRLASALKTTFLLVFIRFHPLSFLFGLGPAGLRLPLHNEQNRAGSK